MEPGSLHGVVKAQLALNGLRIVDVSREMGVHYDRVLRVLHGLRSPRPGEVEKILATVEKLSQRREGGK